MSARCIIVVKDTKHLYNVIQREIWEHGPTCDLNHIDVSQLTSFNAVFQRGLSVQ